MTYWKAGCDLPGRKAKTYLEYKILFTWNSGYKIPGRLVIIYREGRLCFTVKADYDYREGRLYLTWIAGWLSFT